MDFIQCIISELSHSAFKIINVIDSVGLVSSSKADFRCFDDVLGLLIIIAGSGNCKCLQREKEMLAN